MLGLVENDEREGRSSLKCTHQRRLADTRGTVDDDRLEQEPESIVAGTEMIGRHGVQRTPSCIVQRWPRRGLCDEQAPYSAWETEGGTSASLTSQTPRLVSSGIGVTRSLGKAEGPAGWGEMTRDEA